MFPRDGVLDITPFGGFARAPGIVEFVSVAAVLLNPQVTPGQTAAKGAQARSEDGS